MAHNPAPSDGALSESRPRRPGDSTPWLGVTASVLLIAATITLARASESALDRRLDERTAVEAQLLSAQIGAVLDGTSKSFGRLALRISRESYTTELLGADLQSLIGDTNDPLAAIEVYGERMHTVISRMAPSALPPSTSGLVSAMVEAAERGAPVVMPPRALQPGIWGFRLAVAVPGGGAVAATRSFPALLDPIVGQSPYAIRLEADGGVVYSREVAAPGADAISAAVYAPGATWRVSVAPTAALLEQSRSALPVVVLAFGLLLSGSVGWSIELARKSALRAGHIRRASAALEREVAGRAQIEGDLQRTSALQRAILEHASSIIVSLDLDGRVRSFNRTAERLLGYSADEVIGRIMPQLFDGEEVALAAQELSAELGRPIGPGLDVFVAKLEPGVPYTREWTHVARDGRRFPVEMSINAILDDGGVITGYVAVSIDITARRHAELLGAWAEESRRRAEELLHRVLDASTNGIVAAAALRDVAGAIEDFEIILVNPAAERMLKKAAVDLVGRRVSDEMTGDQDGSLLQMQIEVAETQVPADVERRYRRQDVDGWFRLIIVPLGDGIAVTIEDVTLRKRAEEDLAAYIAEVEQSRDQIHQQSVMLQWQAEELTAARDEALAGAREMARALKMQADFVSFASHQLRTPLSGIKWLLGLAMEEPDVRGGLRSYIEESRASTDRLIGLVNDLLDISRLEGGRVVAKPARVDVAALCRDLLAQMEPNLASRRHLLTVEGLDREAPVHVDGQMLQQVVQNLLSNAIKYTPEGGHLRLRLGREGSDVVCVVEDSGVGVPEAARPRLFEKYFRADNVQAMETEGTGLGLFMVRLILEQFGGRIWHEPAPDGTGSRFSFALPLYEPGDDPGQATPDRGRRPRAA